MVRETINWTSVTLKEVIERGKRLEAGVFDLQTKMAHEIVRKSIFGFQSLSEEGILAECFVRGRFKRKWVDTPGIPLYQPTSMLDIDPKPDGYISPSTETDVEALKVRRGQVLITCSGTIGNSSYVSKSLDNKVFSHDLIRVRFVKESDNGFFYAFINTATGKLIMRSNKYGSVITHIEPEHLRELIIPNAPELLKEKIHNLIVRSYELRDESNEKMHMASDRMIHELALPLMEDLEKESRHYSKSITAYSMRSKDLNGRLEASFHDPISEAIENCCSTVSSIKKLKDIASNIVLPGRGKRHYIERGYGKRFIGGKEMGQLSPSTDKYLVVGKYSEQMQADFHVGNNTILITRSGTVGKVFLTFEEWSNWIANDHIIRIFASNDIVGYLSIWLSTAYGKQLICRNIYGSVVLEITCEHVGNITVPILREETVAYINNMVLEANKMRHEAYQLEQEAIRMMDEEVLGIRNERDV